MFEVGDKVKFQLKNILIYFPFLYYYLGPAAFITYLLASRSLLSRFSYWGWVFGLSFTGLILSILINNGIADGLYLVRYCWGFFLFYLIFKSGIQIQVDKLLLFLSIITILEAVLVNTVISAELLPNYPIPGTEGHYAPEGFYQRPYSFGASASVTSVILTALLAVSKLGWRDKSLAIIAIVACLSGSGFLAIFIYFLVRTQRVWYLLLVPVITGIVYSGQFYNWSYHISPRYISYLLEFKTNQAMDQISMDTLFIGVPLAKGVDGLGGDFAILTFIQFNGFIGLLFFLIILVANTNKKNWLPILIMLVGSFQYGSIFFLPGQVMLGYLLNLKPEAIPANNSNNEKQ